MSGHRAVPLLLVAAGGLARETLAAVRADGRHTVVGMLDDDLRRTGDVVGGVTVLGGLAEALARPQAQIVVCAGGGAVREDLVGRLGALGVEPDRFATVVHPRADVGGARLGAGSIVLSGVVATCDVVLGAHVVVMPNVTVTHDVVVEDYATLCAGVTLGGSVRIGRAAYLGMAASVRERTVVGAGAVVGMGAAVLDDVAPGDVCVGVPARPLLRSRVERGARVARVAP